MKKTILIVGIIAFFGTIAGLQAQNNTDQLNNYKYVIIPIQFDFQNEDNQYMVNSKLKHLLNQVGFTTYMDVEELPGDLKMNGCMALHADLKSDAEGFLAMQTKLRLLLKDCRNRVVFESEEGISREKEFKKGYLEALDDIFDHSFLGLHYKYNGHAPEEKMVMAEEDSEHTAPQSSAKTAELQGLAITKDRVYLLNGETYGVHKIEAGYLLLNEKTGDREALLHETEEKTILYNSGTVNGTATIREGGKMIKIEYFDPEKGKLESFTLTEK